MSVFVCQVLLVSGVFVTSVTCLEVKIGGIFEAHDHLTRATFEYAVLSQNDVNATVFKPIVVTVKSDDVVRVRDNVCRLLTEGVIGVLGPAFEPALGQVRAICDDKELPHVAIGSHLRRADGMDGSLLQPTASYSLDLNPRWKGVGRAVWEILRKFNWESLVLVFDHNLALVELEHLTSSRMKILYRKISHHGNLEQNVIAVLNRTKNETAGDRHVLFHTSVATTELLLKHIATLGMTRDDCYHFFFANLDLSTISPAIYREVQKRSGCMVMGLSLIDWKNAKTVLMLRHAVNQLLLRVTSKHTRLPAVGIPTDLAVVYDSVKVLTDAFRRNRGYTGTPLSCDNYLTWRNGTTFMNSIKSSNYTGLTGPIIFDGYGRRTEYDMQILDLGNRGLEAIGVWNNVRGVNISTAPKGLSGKRKRLENVTLRVTVYLEEPFVMLRRTEHSLRGNDRYEGYCIDLLQMIAEDRKFNYTIHEVKDRSYGSQDANGRWNGLVGELYRGEADLALAALTITLSRSSVIDFSNPYMHMGIAILYVQPSRKDPELLTFLSPLTNQVWIYTLIAYLAVSVTLYMTARISPYEWYNPNACNPNSGFVENQFNVSNSLWFTVGSLMQQGSELAPRASSTRVVATMWWLFTLIMISSYTANLMAFLTVETSESAIGSIDDLAQQTKIRYGTLGKGSTMTFFKDSNMSKYKRMWDFMQIAHPSVFVNSSREGVNRVREEKGGYAYFMESSMLTYRVERECDLRQLGGLLDSKHYGIGLPKGSPYREEISTSILKLASTADLSALKEKWWKRRRGGGQCTNRDKVTATLSGHRKLGLQHVGGSFVCLLGGLMIGLVVAVIEFICKSRENAEIDKRSLLVVLWQELQFAMRCKGSHKPAVPTRKKHRSLSVSSLFGAVPSGGIAWRRPSSASTTTSPPITVPPAPPPPFAKC